MPLASRTSTDLADPLADLDPADVVDEYDRRRLDDISDAALLDAVAQRIAQPRVDPADSFVLHAPLEVLARASLLRWVPGPRRRTARQRLAWVAATYDTWGPAIELEPPSPPDAADPVALANRLAEAIAAGDLDDAPRLAAELAHAATTEQLRALVAPLVLPSLAAAGHASIFFHLLPRVADQSTAAATMLAATARELARHPDWRLTWHERDQRVDEPARRSLIQAIATTERIGPPEVPFIFPLMDHAERHGVAAETVADAVGPDTDPFEAGRALSRLAAWSMLLDDPAHAPYGWTHALTLPQALASCASTLDQPHRGVALAATHLVGFRTGQGTMDLAPPTPPAGRQTLGDVLAAVDAGEGDAGVRALALDPPDRPALATALAGIAAVHPDAHLAKYVNACFDAARADGEQSGTYLAAATHLAAWWRRAGGFDDDPIGV